MLLHISHHGHYLYQLTCLVDMSAMLVSGLRHQCQLLRIRAESETDICQLCTDGMHQWTVDDTNTVYSILRRYRSYQQDIVLSTVPGSAIIDNVLLHSAYDCMLSLFSVPTYRRIDDRSIVRHYIDINGLSNGDMM